MPFRISVAYMLKKNGIRQKSKINISTNLQCKELQLHCLLHAVCAHDAWQLLSKAICNWCIVFVSCQFFFLKKKSSVFAIHTNASSQCFFKFIHSGAHFQQVLLLATEDAVLVWMERQSGEKKLIWLSVDVALKTILGLFWSNSLVTIVMLLIIRKEISLPFVFFFSTSEQIACVLCRSL